MKGCQGHNSTQNIWFWTFIKLHTICFISSTQYYVHVIYYHVYQWFNFIAISLTVYTTYIDLFYCWRILEGLWFGSIKNSIYTTMHKVDSLVGTCFIAQGVYLGALWRPKWVGWEREAKEGYIYVCMCVCVCVCVYSWLTLYSIK